MVSTDILGDVATWLSAVGTLGAFAIGFRQIHTERHERKKRETKEWLQEERSQAQKLSAWIDETGSLAISNSSPHPVHHVVVELSDGQKIEKHTVAPGTAVTPLENPGNAPSITDFIFTDTHTHARWRKVPGKPLEKAS